MDVRKGDMLYFWPPIWYIKNAQAFASEVFVGSLCLVLDDPKPMSLAMSNNTIIHELAVPLYFGPLCPVPNDCESWFAPIKWLRKESPGDIFTDCTPNVKSNWKDCYDKCGWKPKDSQYH